MPQPPPEWWYVWGAHTNFDLHQHGSGRACVCLCRRGNDDNRTDNYCMLMDEAQVCDGAACLSQSSFDKTRTSSQWFIYIEGWASLAAAALLDCLARCDLLIICRSDQVREGAGEAPGQQAWEQSEVVGRASQPAWPSQPASPAQEPKPIWPRLLDCRGLRRSRDTSRCPGSVV